MSQGGQDLVAYVCNGSDGAKASASVAGEAPGANCASGGAAITTKVGAASPVTSYVCNGAAGAAGSAGESVVATAEPAGVNCANGGVRLQVGAAAPQYVCNGAAGAAGESVAVGSAGTQCANGGAKLQVGTAPAVYVCNGADGAPGLPVTMATEPPGSNCPNGGVVLQQGAGAPTYVCSGAAGANGTDGVDGQSASVAMEPPGANCASGGVKVQVGSGAPTYVCNGAPGTNGADGQGATVTPEPAGTNCAYGGVKVQVGSGTPSYACNGAPGGGPCMNVPPLAVSAFTMSAGMPYTATVTVSYTGTNTLHYSFMGEGGSYAQIGSGDTFTFTPNVSGGPYTSYVLVDDGCQFAWGQLAGIYTPPADVSNLAASAILTTSLTLTWTNPGSANFAGAEITWTGGAGGGPVTVASTASPNNQATIAGLAPATSYTFTVKALDAHGSKSAGATLVASTVSGKVVFLAGVTYAGTFGGRAGADALCQARANAGAVPAGTYVAFLSTGPGDNAGSRLADAPYLTTAGDLIATSKANLLSGTLLHGIDRDENGVLHSGWWVWTGATATGDAAGTDQCGGWVDGAANGVFGMAGQTDATWASRSLYACSGQVASLYCFQQ